MEHFNIKIDIWIDTIRHLQYVSYFFVKLWDLHTWHFDSKKKCQSSIEMVDKMNVTVMGLSESNGLHCGTATKTNELLLLLGVFPTFLHLFIFPVNNIEKKKGLVYFNK